MKSVTLALILGLAAVPALADKRVDDAVARAEDQIKKGKPEEALKTLQKLVQQAPGPESQLALARIQVRAATADEALASAKLAADAASSATPDVKAQVLAGVANVELALGARKEATTHAQAAVQAQASADALAAVARAHAASFEAGPALDSAEKAVAAGATSAYAHLARGEALLLGGKPADAAASFNKALELDPKLTIARVRLASALIAQGKAAEAEAEAKKATEADDKLAEGFSVWGRAILAADPKRWSDAIAQAQQGAFLAPKNAAVQVDVAKIFEAADNVDQASAAYQRALAADPGYPPASAGLVNVEVRKTSDPKKLEALIQQSPQNGALYVALGSVYLRSGDFDKALPPLQKAVQLLPASAEANARVGTAYQYNGKPVEALQYYKKAVELDPGNLEFRTTYGIILGVNKQYDQGIAELQKVVANPAYKKADAHINLGWLYRSIDPARSADSVTAYQKALAMDPKNPHASLGLGWAYSSGKQWPQAIDAFQKAIVIEPKNAGAAYNGIAWAYLLQKDFAKAKEFMDKAEGAGRSDTRLTETLEKIQKAIAAGKAAEAENELRAAEARRQREAAEEDDRDDFDSLVQRLAYSKDPGARRSAAAKLASFNGKSVNALIRALDDENRAVRIAAAQALGNIGPAAKAAYQYLTRASHRSEPQSVVPTEAELKAHEAEKPFRDAIRDALLKIGR
jgi:tetratricopeptide (TPR) repeat protein